MEIFLYRNGSQTGPYTEQQLRDMVSSGEIGRTEHAWHQGLAEWQPLENIVPFAVPASPPPPPRQPFGQSSVSAAAPANQPRFAKPAIIIFTLLALLIIGFLVFHSRTPSADAARKFLEGKIRQNSSGCIKIVSCEKTNGVEHDFMGHQIYELECKVTVEFLQNCTWDQSAQFHADPRPLDSRQYTVMPNHTIVQKTSWYGRPFDPVSYPYYWHKGEQASITEKFEFEKTERGWRDREGDLF